MFTEQLSLEADAGWIGVHHDGCGATFQMRRDQLERFPLDRLLQCPRCMVWENPPQLAPVEVSEDEGKAATKGVPR